MPTSAAVKIILELTKSPSRQKQITNSQIWKAFPVNGRGMLVRTIREVLRKEQFDGKSEWDIQCENRSATLTRRSNKVYNRLEDAFRSISRYGAEGVYSLSFRSWQLDEVDGAFGMVFANSRAEAAQLFKTMFEPFLNERSVDDGNVTFVDFATVDDLGQVLKKMEKHYQDYSSKVDKKVEDLKLEIERQRQKVKKIETLRMASSQLLLMTTEE